MPSKTVQVIRVPQHVHITSVLSLSLVNSAGNAEAKPAVSSPDPKSSFAMGALTPGRLACRISSS